MTQPDSSRTPLELASALWGRARTYAKGRGLWNLFIAVAILLLVALGLYVFRLPIVAVIGDAGAGAGLLLIAVGSLVLALLFLWLFAGEPTIPKLDAMVRFSYLFTLLAIGASILPFFALQYLPGFQNAMRVSPVGIVRGCNVAPAGADDVLPSEITCGVTSQWVVNIGGLVLPATVEPADEQPPVAAPFAGAADRIQGGLVVPLYFIVLSLMGAAVGMARRVPEYQRQFSAYAFLTDPPAVGGALSAEDARKLGTLVDVGEGKAMSPQRVREHLVFQIMQVISAPLIAIVAYHLIEPDEVAVTVAVGFAAGFGAEPILLMVRRFANALAPAQA